MPERERRADRPKTKYAGAGGLLGESSGQIRRSRGRSQLHGQHSNSHGNWGNTRNAGEILLPDADADQNKDE